MNNLFTTNEAKLKRQATEAGNAFREALAEQPAQQQEPLCTAAMFDEAFLVKSGLSPDTLLYTSSPASKPWVGLTDEDIKEAEWLLSAIKQYEAYTLDELLTVEGVDAFARAIEAKLKEKNT
jgi:hypothetical protein